MPSISPYFLLLLSLGLFGRRSLTKGSECIVKEIVLEQVKLGLVRMFLTTTIPFCDGWLCFLYRLRIARMRSR